MADLGLEKFRETQDAAGLSLDQLSQAFARMLGTGEVPYEAPPEDAAPQAEGGEASDTLIPAAEAPPAESCDITPRTILEALLFVGDPGGAPLTSQRVAGLMRGVRPAEIDELIRDLNATYAAAGCPYRIASAAAGYYLALLEEFAPLRLNFEGRVRQARLSPAAIEALAMVAYNQPLTADDVTRLRGAASGSILSQLVRRQLLRIERDEAQPRQARYYTTARFLELFSLSSLEELPRSQDLEKQ